MDGFLRRAVMIEHVLELVTTAALHKNCTTPLRDGCSHRLERRTNLDLLRKISLLKHTRADLVRLSPNDEQPVAVTQWQCASEAAVVFRRVGAELFHTAKNVESRVA